METRSPTVLVAVSSASLLARLHQAWLLDRNVPVLGVTTNGADAAQWMVELSAQVALCDVRILRHPAVKMLFAPSPKPLICRIVLVAKGAEVAAVPEAIPVCAVLGSEMDPDIVVTTLRMLVAPLNSIPLFSSLPGQRARSVTDEMMIRSAEKASAQQEEIRYPRAKDPLIGLLRNLQAEPDQCRDRITGLTTSQTLIRVLTAWPALNHAATIAVLVLRSRKAGVPFSADEQPARPMRMMAAGLRAHLRQTDLVYRLNGPAFAVVLPHSSGSTPQLAQRLRGMLDAIQRLILGERAELTAKMGLGFCEPGAAITPSLARAWREATE